MSIIRGLPRKLANLNFKQGGSTNLFNTGTHLNTNLVKPLHLKTNVTLNTRRFSTTIINNNKDEKEENEKSKPFKNPLNFDTTERFENEEVSKKSLIDNSAAETTDKEESNQNTPENKSSADGKKESNLNQNKYRKKSKLSTDDQGGSKASTFIGSTILLSLLSLGVYQFIAPYTNLELENDSDLSESDDFLTRAKNRVHSQKDYLTKPTHKVLLPPSQYPEGQRPNTLILELDETLIKLVWDREHGYRAAKRPGLDKFLGLMSYMYEIVIFTSLHEFSSEPLILKLDPYKMCFSYTLYREHTSYLDNKIVKDLSLLNRDLKRLVIMDSNEDHYSLHPSNAIKVPAWDGNPNDTYLLDIIPFMETIAISDPSDVRPVLEKYYGEDIPTVFRELEEKQMLELAKKRNSGLRNFLSGVNDANSKSDLPLTSMMLKRKHIEEQYFASRPQMIEQAKQYLEEEKKMMEKMMGEAKMTGWQSMSMFFSPPKQPDEQPKGGQ